jgi:hypothetical protein
MASVAVMLTMGLRGTATNSAPQRSARRPRSGDDFNIFVFVICVSCQRVHQVGRVGFGVLETIEAADIPKTLPRTCGGRSLNDDVMDTLYTLLVNANNGPRISGGVTRETTRRPICLSVPGSAQSAVTGTNKLAEIAALIGRQTEAHTLTEKPKGDGP